MFVSHYAEEDFFFFFESLGKITEALDINLEIKYLCQDADIASYNAIKRYSPETEVIMCYFHVMMNVKKRKNVDIPIEFYDEVCQDIRRLHYSTSDKIFNKRLRSVMQK